MLLRVRALLLSLALAAGACAGGSLRLRSPQASASPPQIERLEDLGALALRSGRLQPGEGDGRFTPGEWVVVHGRSLHDAELAVDGTALAPGGFLPGGSVVVRLPGSLPPGEHRLVARSPRGEATATFASLVHVIGSDTVGHAVRFLRVGAGGRDRVEEADLEVEQENALYHALSPDAGLLYSLGMPGRLGGVPGRAHAIEVAIVHLGAAGGPERVGAVTVRMDSYPSAVAVTPRGLLLLLGMQELIAFSLADPLRPREVGRLAPSPASGDRWSELAVLHGGAAVAILDGARNRVRAVSLEDPALPREIADLALAPEGALPLTVDLVADPADPSAAVVLMGRNLRTLGAKAKGGAVKLAGKAFDLVRGKKAAEKPAPEEEATPARGRLVTLRLVGGALEKGAETELPWDFIPLFSAPWRDGRFLVSGVAPGALAGKLDASIDSAARVLRFLKESAQLGKILSVGRDGTVAVEQQGVGLVFDVDALPQGELVYSGMRLTGKPLPPFVTVKWGVGIGGTGFYGLHVVDDDYFLPPYSYGQLSVQRGAR